MDTTQIDRAFSELEAAKGRWADLEFTERIEYIDGIRRNMLAVSKRWVEAATKAKSLSMEEPLAAEEWLGGPFSVLYYLNDVEASLKRMADGGSTVDDFTVRTLPNGQVVVDVFPNSTADRLLFSGHSGEVWMDPSVTTESLPSTLALPYQDEDHTGSVEVVLAAGNVASIAPLDVLFALFNNRNVVMVKMNPVNDYLGEFFEASFAELIRDGFVRFVYGNADVGEYITKHEVPDAVHLTGSIRTYNAIVYGTGSEGEANRTADRPITNKRVTAELGGVSPTIVVPGKWSKRDIRFQAEHIVSQKMHNVGFNCVATQVLVLPDDWDQKDELLDEIRTVLSELSDRDPYYPGADARCARALETAPSSETFGIDFERHLISGLDAADASEWFFEREVFGPVLGVVALPGGGVDTYLTRAVRFANERLSGTLGAGLLIHPRTRRRYRAAYDKAIADLEYGTIAVNTWTAVAYFFPRCVWGAYPGAPRNETESGVGFVHNAMMFGKPQKSVVTGPFAPSERAWMKGEFNVAPKPVFFVSNKSTHRTSEALVEYAADPTMFKLARVASHAVRG